MIAGRRLIYQQKPYISAGTERSSLPTLYAIEPLFKGILLNTQGLKQLLPMRGEGFVDGDH